MSAMRARHSTLEQFIANEVEYKSSSERMVIRQQIHPTAAQVLREFAAQVIEHDVVAHKKTPRGEPWGEVFCHVILAPTTLALTAVAVHLQSNRW